MTSNIAKLHIMQQDAFALLNPVRLELAQLEARLQNYLDRLAFDEDDLSLIESARAALAVAQHKRARLSEEAAG
mgnify:CR=1 FL=1